MPYDGKVTMDYLLKQVQIDEKWLVKEENTVTISYSRFGQKITMEEIRHPDSPEDTAVVFTITSGMLKGVKNTFENKKIINDCLCSNASMCVPVFDEKKEELYLLSRAALNEDTYNWLGLMLSYCMIIQQHEVLKNAEQMAEMTHAEPDYYSHPINGIREDTDEIVTVYDHYIKPFGLKESRCSDEEMKKVCDQYMNSFPFVLTTQGKGSITTELPLGIETSLLEFKNNTFHEDYNYGFAVKHSFFRPKDEEQGLNLVFYHNRQLSLAQRSYGMGSFFLVNGFLTYRLFVPNIICNKGMFFNLLLSSVIKGQGMNRFLGYPVWNKETYQKCLKKKEDYLVMFEHLMESEVNNGNC